MLTVIKRSGKEEPFSIEKIKNSTATASDELHQPLGSSDINNLAADLEQKLAGKEKVTAQELFDILIQTMRKEGFTELADSYEASGSGSRS